MLDADSYRESANIRRQLLAASAPFKGVYVDTIVSPSLRSALAQSLQVPGVSGMENNSVLFEFPFTIRRRRSRKSCVARPSARQPKKMCWSCVTVTTILAIAATFTSGLRGTTTPMPR
jgi:hypothetical protein